MLKVASDIYKTPLYRTAHSPENSSDEWAFFFPCIKFTFVITQIAIKSVVKIIIFYFILHPEERMSCQSRKVFVFSGIEKNKEKQDVKK